MCSTPICTPLAIVAFSGTPGPRRSRRMSVRPAIVVVATPAINAFPGVDDAAPQSADASPLKAELREEALKNGRSLNAEILYRLLRSLNEYSR